MTSPHLKSFNLLAPEILYYTPIPNQTTTPTTHDATDSPTLILLLTWMDAQPRHISKFTSHYQTTYPSASILIVRSSISDLVFYASKSRQRSKLAAALATIRTWHLQQSGRYDGSGGIGGGGGEGGLLVQTMSNAGAGQLVLLSKAYHDQTGSMLPADLVIFDSGPGRMSMWPTFGSASMGLPKMAVVRLPLQAVLVVVLFVFFSVPGKWNLTALADEWREDLHACLPAGAGRVYICSDVDREVLMEDVEGHAEVAEGRGLQVVVHRFGGSGHVEHMRRFPERYWGIVEQAWRERSRG